MKPENLFGSYQGQPFHWERDASTNNFINCGILKTSQGYVVLDQNETRYNMGNCKMVLRPKTNMSAEEVQEHAKLLKQCDPLYYDCDELHETPESLMYLVSIGVFAFPGEMEWYVILKEKGTQLFI